MAKWLVLGGVLGAVVGCSDNTSELAVTSLLIPNSPGTTVYFQNADSSLVSATVTGENGLASATMEAGGFVTAVRESLAYDYDHDEPGHPSIVVHILNTFVGVKPGDELYLGPIGNSYPNGHEGVLVNLIVDPDPNVSGGHYNILTPDGCGSYEGITREDGSLGGGHGFRCGYTTDVTITASDDQGNMVSSIHKDNVALVQGGSIDFTDLAYIPVKDWDFEYTNVPASITSFVMQSELFGTNGPQFAISDEGAFVDGKGATAGHTRPGNDFALQKTYSMFLGANTEHEIIDWGPPTTAYSASLDLLMPDIATPPQYDIPSRTLRWTTGVGATPDLVVASMGIFRTGGLQYSWSIVAPLDGDPAVRFPVMPAPDDKFNPRLGDDVRDGGLATWKVPGGYDAVRETFGPHADGTTYNVGSPNSTIVTTGAAGTIVVARSTASAERALAPFTPRNARSRTTKALGATPD